MALLSRGELVRSAIACAVDAAGGEKRIIRVRDQIASDQSLQ